MYAFKHHKLDSINSPLGNEFILDDEWLLEIDPDGGFAITVSHFPREAGTYGNTHKLVVISTKKQNHLLETCNEIEDKVMKAIIELYG